MTITRNFKLCLNAGTQNAPYINVNQYDEGEQWIFDLYTEGGQKFTPSTGAIIGIKSDGNAILNSGTVNSDGQVVITETQQMTAASGLAVFELLIEGETHGTANFIVNVERRPSDDAEFSDSDLSMLQEAIDAAEVINEILDEGGDPSEIITENVNAWLDNHPEATTTVQDGAITAPKINSTLWDKLLVSEEASGAVASFDDGADDVPVSSLKVALEPIQTGTGDPSPSNVRPIIASNGKNLLQNVNSTRTQNGITYTVNADGSVTATGTATNGSYFVFTSVNNSINDYTVTIIPSGTSIIASTDSTKVLRVRYTDGTYENLTNGSAKTLTKNIGLVLVEYSSGTTANETIKPMIRLASITDPSYQPYQSIMVERKGRNLYKTPTNRTVTISGVTFTYTSEGTIKVSGTASATVNLGILSAQSGSDQNVDTIKTGTYIISASGLNSNVILIYGSGGNTAGITYTEFNSDNSKTFTCSDGTTGYNTLRVVSGATVNTEVKIQLEYGETAHEFEPYQSASYPYTLGREVYGGTVDLATGVLTVTKWIVDLGSSNVIYSVANDKGWTQITTVGAKPFDNGAVADVYCDILVADTANRVYQRAKDNSIAINSTGRIQFVMSSIANLTASQIRTALTGHYVVYPLVTPTTVQLTPQEVKTLLGYNNISSTGTVDVIYHADTKLYIDKKIGELS